MTAQPLVTVICICYRHERFVRDAVYSVLTQTYPHIQLIVVDDASDDDSASVIRSIVAAHPEVVFLPLEENVGNCRAFNKALPLVQGSYIIDLAADDVLLPERVARGVEAFQDKDERYALQFTDAVWMTEDARLLYRHADRFPHHTIPQGDVYRDIIQRYFICSPTMMFRTSMIRDLGGYDESLAYEDFDLWVRAAREYWFFYIPEVLVKKRVVRHSMSERQFMRQDRQRYSTFRICEKIARLNRNDAERRALGARLIYEIKQALLLADMALARQYVSLWWRNRWRTFD